MIVRVRQSALGRLLLLGDKYVFLFVFSIDNAKGERRVRKGIYITSETLFAPCPIDFLAGKQLCLHLIQL